jgi:hypothetical protein
LEGESNAEADVLRIDLGEPGLELKRVRVEEGNDAAALADHCMYFFADACLNHAILSGSNTYLTSSESSDPTKGAT